MDWRELLENNRAWVNDRKSQDPEFFRRLGAKHEPHFLWIGCSDARVPANVITGTDAGEMFVHRNIANQVQATDANLAAVVQYAVEVLKVKDIIVCGHEDCGGVRAALGPQAPVAVEHWIAQVRSVARVHAEELDAIDTMDRRVARLVELNVTEQVMNLARTPVLQAAWARGEEIDIHGVVYDVREGYLRDIQVSLDSTSLAARPRLAAPVRPASRPEPELRATG